MRLEPVKRCDLGWLAELERCSNWGDSTAHEYLSLWCRLDNWDGDAERGDEGRGGCVVDRGSVMLLSFLRPIASRCRNREASVR